MFGTKAKSSSSLERAVAKYEAKLAKAPNPTQRQYAAKMLHMARSALAESLTNEPDVEPDPDGAVTLREDEYAVT